MKIRLGKVLLLVLTIGLCAATNSFQSPSVDAQQPSRTISLPGLHGGVTVRRDERGIPYIEAANDEDLYFAQGYVTAADRLWQMDVMRRTARGELSEIFGQATLGEDKRHRTLGFARILEESAAHLPADLSRALDAYAK